MLRGKKIPVNVFYAAKIRRPLSNDVPELLFFFFFFFSFRKLFNSWRFSVRLAYRYVGKSALLTGQCELSCCTALFYDQPWPGNDAGDDLVYFVQRGLGDTAHTAYTPYACPMFCLVVSFPAIRDCFFLAFYRRGKRFSKTRNKMLQFANFP